MENKFKTDNSIVYFCTYHVVWCSKYRRKILTGEIADRMCCLIMEYIEELPIEILLLEVLPDHIHIKMEVSPKYGIHKAVKSMKAYTAGVLRKEFPDLTTKLPTLWSSSYFVTTVGDDASEEAIKQYIESQKTSQRQKDRLG